MTSFGHPAWLNLRGDRDGYNIHITSVRPFDGQSGVVEGEFRDDGIKAHSPARPAVTFEVIVPHECGSWSDFDWGVVNGENILQLRTGISHIRTDARPRVPLSPEITAVNAQPNSAAGAAVGLALILGAAFALGAVLERA
jgi:hypothetical protein